VALDDLQRETLMQLQDAMTKWAMTVDDVETAYTWSMPWPTLTSRTGRPQLVRWSWPVSAAAAVWLFGRHES